VQALLSAAGQMAATRLAARPERRRQVALELVRTRSEERATAFVATTAVSLVEILATRASSERKRLAVSE
jgi:hypothetical protein